MINLNCYHWLGGWVVRCWLATQEVTRSNPFHCSISLTVNSVKTRKHSSRMRTAHFCGSGWVGMMSLAVWSHVFSRGCLVPGDLVPWDPRGYDTTAHPVDRMTNRYKSITFLQVRLRAVMILEKSNDFGRHDRQNSFITNCVFVLFCSSGTTSGWRGTSRTSTTSVSSSSLLTGCGFLTYH